MRRSLRGRGRWLRLPLLGAAALGVVACGAASVPEVTSQTPFSTASVVVTESGNAAATLDTGSVRFHLDGAGLLVVTALVTSTSRAPETISAHADVYGPQGNLVANAIGADVSVPPGGTRALQLDGPAPNGTIASAVVELSTAAPSAVTPVPG